MNGKVWIRVSKRMVLVVAVLLLAAPAVLAAPAPPVQNPTGGGMGGGGCGPNCGGGGGGGGAGSALTTFVTTDFSGSGNCAMCHSSLRDSAGNDVSIDTQWRSTMMANAAKDPLWQAKIESEVTRNPALQPVIEEKCSRCHTPMAHTQAVADGSSVAVLGSGFLSASHPLYSAAMDGVSCSLCHQIRSGGLGQPETFTGRYVIDTSTVAPDRPMYARFSNPMQQPMRMNVGFTPMQGTQTALSGLCGTCHTLYTPSVDAAGNVLGEFPEQMTYLEWEHSAYGDGVGSDQSCQQCHLPPAPGSVQIANRPMRLPARSPFAQHYLVGSNTLMTNVLKNHQTELGVTASAANLDATLARLNDLLQTKTASLAVANARVSGSTLAVTLDVQNMTGHKLPSGIPARRAWVHLTVTDASGATLFESGRPLADGRISGNDADWDAARFEPHYDLISTADQVQIYESVMLDSDGLVTYTLLRAASYAKDNRLLPSGFDTATASADIAVQGEAVSDSNFLGGSDQVTYAIDVQGRPRPLTVAAQLLYQPVSYPFVHDLRQDAVTLVQRLAGYYDTADKSPAVLASAQQTVR
jgi:hypothetical protein